jgi:hypothetical protein
LQQASLQNEIYLPFSFTKVYLKSKKNVYPVHTPATTDYIMFKFSEVLSISTLVVLYKELLLKKAAIIRVKKDELLVWHK